MQNICFRWWYLVLERKCCSSKTCYRQCPWHTTCICKWPTYR